MLYQAFVIAVAVVAFPLCYACFRFGVEIARDKNSSHTDTAKAVSSILGFMLSFVCLIAGIWGILTIKGWWM